MGIFIFCAHKQDHIYFLTRFLVGLRLFFWCSYRWITIPTLPEFPKPWLISWLLRADAVILQRLQGHLGIYCTEVPVPSTDKNPGPYFLSPISCSLRHSAAQLDLWVGLWNQLQGTESPRLSLWTLRSDKGALKRNSCKANGKLPQGRVYISWPMSLQRQKREGV